MDIPRFHLAFPVHDLEQARLFYTELLGCEIGRHSDTWIDFNLYGHQIVAHLSPHDCSSTKKNEVDGDDVPSRHFGVILPWDKWDQLAKFLKDKDITWLIEPRVSLRTLLGNKEHFSLLTQVVII